MVSAIHPDGSIANHNLLVFIALALAILTGCGGSEEYLGFRGETMGTNYTISYRDDPGCEIQQGDIDSLLIAINNTMSTYQSDSELSLLNQKKTPGEYPISRELSFVLRAAERVWYQTNGAFDVTIGPLINLWGFGPSKVASEPTTSEQDNIKSRIGMVNLMLGTDSLVKKQHDMYVDLSAIAKGYAVDRLSDFLEGRGCNDHLVDIGGEARLRGHNSFGEPWRIGIEKPHGGRDRVQRVLKLSDVGIATSGNYRNFRDGQSGRVSHVMDPRSGMPSKSRVASATVLHNSTMMADAYATSLMVLGHERGMLLAQEEKIAVYMILEEPSGRFEERYNDQMRKYMRPVRD